MRTLVSSILALSLLLGTYAHSFYEKKSKQETFDVVDAEPSADDNHDHPTYCLETIGVIVLIGLQGYLQYQEFMRYT